MRTRTYKQRSSLEDKLQHELKRLKKRAGMGQELKVIWLPNPSERLSGKVEGDLIYIYKQDEGKALETLRHEFVDYAVSRAIEPYMFAANKLVQLINEMSYRRKEEAVEAILRLL